MTKHARDRPEGAQLVTLERALRGGDPKLSPEWAAEALRKSTAGARRLTEIIRSSEPSRIRRAAVYGFVFGKATQAELELLLSIFADADEDPNVRGQAAEALGPRIAASQQRARASKLAALASAAFVRGLEDPAPVVRFWSIFALAQPGNDWAIAKLARLKKDKTLVPGLWRISQEAAWAISWIRGEDIDREPRDFEP